MRSPEAIAAIFNDAADTYDNVGVDFFSPIGAELVHRAGIAAGEDVLDVGCGRGAVLLPAAAAGARVTGIDLAPEMIRLTAAAIAGRPDVTVAVGDAQAPDFPPASFDVITAGLVLFFLPDPAAALTNYRGLLRPGGRAAFTSFAAYDPRYPAALRALARHAVDPPPPPPVDPMFGSDASVADGLLAAGYTDPVVETFEIRSRFRDGDHFLQWTGSHAGRALLRRIPPDALAAARADALAVIGEPLELTTSIRFAMGHA